MTSSAYDFLVRRDDLRQGTIRPAPAADEIDLAPGQALLRIDNFSISANNVTYAALGDAMNYWEFFPSGEAEFGRVPAWGYCEVVRSEHDDLPVGKRIYGYMPMSTHFVVEPTGVSSSGFVDGADHRSALPAVYNRYGYTTPEEGDGESREPYVALFGPLFFTSWLLADEIVEEKFYGATRLLCSSASSKTALSLAFMLKRDHSETITLVGLTSAGNKGFVEGTGFYDEVVTYDDLDQLDPAVANAYIDFGGSADLRGRIHNRFGENLLADTVVGAADWEELAPDPDAEPLSGPKPGFFFAPNRVAKRNEDWGAAELRRKIANDQEAFIDSSKDWMTIRTGNGPEDMQRTFGEFLDGNVDPAEGWNITP
ncbi:MAG: DUF2855 family protein [Thermoleophilia bacterium]|nr:DUF2855 family protein [Thermoleophilia bacterium]